jgi:hypothetical protein
MSKQNKTSSRGKLETKPASVLPVTAHAHGRERASWMPALLRILFLMIVLACATSGLAQSWLLNSHMRITKAVMPEYLDFGSKPAAIFRADQIYEDYQRRGFFRIGVLPMVVLEGLSLELCDTNQLSVALTRTSTHFGSKGKASNAVEGRNFSLSFSGQKNAVIHAQIVRLESGTEWRLQEGTVDQPGAASISFRRATLTIVGPKAGELACATTNGLVHLDLLSLASPKHP